MHSLLPTLRPSLAARRLSVRLALFALLVAALVPTVSRLLQPVGLAEWAALCQSSSSTLQVAGGPAPGSTPGTGQDVHAHDEACALCSLAHTTPTLGGAALPAVVVLAYAPPTPPAHAIVRTHVTQSRAPSARAPPFAA
jgi:hypothetical protein